MFLLYRFFALQIIQTSSLAFLILFLVSIAFAKLGCDENILIALCTFVFPFMFCFLSPAITTFPNSSWLRRMPISKRSILVLQYLLGLTTLIYSVITGSLISLIVLVARNGIKESTNSVFSFFSKSYSRIATSLAQNSYYEYAGLVLFILFFNFALTIHITSTRNASFGQSAKYQRKISFIILGVFIALFVLNEILKTYIQAPFAIYSFFAICIFAFPLVSLHHLQIDKTILKKACFAQAILCLLFCSSIYYNAKTAFQAKEIKSITNAFLFLGAWNKSVSRESFAQLIYDNSDSSSLEELISDYKSRYNEGKRINLNEHPELALSLVIPKKNQYKALLKIQNLYSPESFSFEQIREFLSAAERLKRGTKWPEAYSEYVFNKLSSTEVITLLKSANEHEVRLGLAIAALRRSKDYIPVIVSQIRSYLNTNKSYAVYALQLLTGKPLGYDEYADITNGKIALNYYNPDCSGVSIKALEATDDLTEILRHNVCWKDKAILNVLSKKCLNCWTSLVAAPLTSYERDFIKKTFKAAE